MLQKYRLIMILLVIVLLPITNAGATAVAVPGIDPVYQEDMHIALEAGYRFEKGAWIANSYDNALVLIGSEEDNVLKVAVVSRVSDGQYQIAACSEKILSYDDYNNCSVQLLDKWRDGHPHFSCEIKDSTSARPIKLIYIYVEQDVSGSWNVVTGYIHYYEEDLRYKFFATDNPYEIGVMYLISPQIYWPRQETLALEGFDLAAAEEDCTEALQYLRDFFTTHDSGERDETYTIVWQDDSSFQQ